ncbi:uncharacterized protein LOC126676442 isoform X2 [Mercurialis annua]|uniref:uncharacterized protein LOC126676442 isoform X2 n=1 Tax=Mercurialis annua TaxID=3986 RepID=UPI00215E3402|nr:uncharacterized protein LOC126676442 isoform X2 [Mercurialis annua]
MATCKTYDQKPLVNGGGLDNSMYGIIGLKFSSFIKSDLTWKKDNRSSSRRARNSVSRSWKAGEEVTKMFPNNEDMSILESEKLGVSVLGCHFNENADRVRTKKRKLTVTSTPKVSSKCMKETKRRLKCQPVAVDYGSCTNDLGQIVDAKVAKHKIDEKNLKRVSKQVNDKEDFSGIFILAAAACNDLLREGDDHVGEGSRVEDPNAHESVSVKSSLHSLSKKKLKEDFCSTNVSTQGAGYDIYKVKEGSSHNSMDVRACPVDYQFADSNTIEGIPQDVKYRNSCGKIRSSGSETIQGEPEGSVCDTDTRLLPADPGGIGHEEQSSNAKGYKLDSWTDIDRSSCSREKLSSSENGDFVSNESSTLSNDRDRCASSHSLTWSSTENSKGSSPLQLMGLNSIVLNPLSSMSSPTLRTCISRASCDAASAKNQNGRETLSLGLHVTSSVNTPGETLDGLNECFQSAKDDSVCQSTECTGVEMSTIGVLALDSEVQDNNDIEHDDTNAYQNNSKDIVKGYDKMTKEVPSDNGNNSDVSQDIHKKNNRYDADYDSQYEDGELRESVEHPWQEYDGDDLEVELVDYGSDTNNLGSQSEKDASSMQGMNLQTRSKWLTESEAHGVAKTGDIICNRPKVLNYEGVIGGDIDTGKDAKLFGGRYFIGKRNISGEGADRVETLNGRRATELRTFTRDMCSHMEEQNFHDVAFRSRDRYTRHHYAGDQGYDRLVNSRHGNFGIRRNYSPRSNPSMSFRHFGPSKRMHCHPTRSRSPGARIWDFDRQLHSRSFRNPSPGQRMTLGRERSVRYGLEVEGRGLESQYHDHVPADDCNEFSMSHSLPFSKRERSLSPINRRREPHVHRSRSSSSSKNRSCSSGNPSLRCRSKSPNFRYAMRTQTTRSPCRRPYLLVDRVGGYKTPPRNHGSPPRSTRWIGDSKEDAVQVREIRYNKHSSLPFRRSQGRFVQRDNRFDIIDSPRPFRSMHPRRFMDMCGTVGGNLRHDENDENRGNQRNRYGPPHPVKRYDINEHVKRPSYNVVYGYNTRGRDVQDYNGRENPKCHGMESKIGDSPRKFREDRGQFRY